MADYSPYPAAYKVTFGVSFAPTRALPRRAGFREPALGELTLFPNPGAVDELSPTNTFVGQVNGTTPGSTLSLIDSAGSRFKLIGIEVFVDTVITDYETATSHNITVRETLSGSPNSPRDTVLPIVVNDVTETASLAALTLSASTVAEGSAADVLVGNIVGLTGGSTVTMPDNGGGRFKIVGTAVYTASVTTDYETQTTHGIVIRETLATSPNSPRDTSLTITVTDVVEGGYTPSLDFSDARNSMYL